MKVYSNCDIYASISRCSLFLLQAVQIEDWGYIRQCSPHFNHANTRRGRDCAVPMPRTSRMTPTYRLALQSHGYWLKISERSDLFKLGRVHTQKQVMEKKKETALLRGPGDFSEPRLQSSSRVPCVATGIHDEAPILVLRRASESAVADALVGAAAYPYFDRYFEVFFYDILRY